MNWNRLRVRSAWVAAFALAAGCSVSRDSSETPTMGPNYPGGGVDAGGGGGGGGGGNAETGGTGGLPPEQEVESFYESPVATGRYVWIANPVSGRVAYVDAVTLEVKTTEAGNGPTWLAPVPSESEDVAVVINALSANATILRASAQGKIESKSVPVAAENNAWAVSGHGAWAIAWTNAKTVTAPTDAQGFQDVTVVSLKKGEETSTRLSVGYRPVTLTFSADETHAYAVTQDGISVIELQAPGGPAAVKIVPMSADPLEDPGTRDVAVTPDGAYAMVRRDGDAHLTVVKLEDGTLTDVLLPGAVTDLDIAPNGEHAVAVIRDLGQAAVLPIPGIVSDPTTFATAQIDGVVVGSVAMASGAQMALLFSNATDQERVVKLEYGATVPSVQTLTLHAPVLGVFVASTGASAIVLHKAVADAGTASAGAFSVMNIAPLLPAKIVGTLAPPTAVALTPLGDYGIVAEREDTTHVYGAYLVRAANQQVDRYSLASPPIAVGALPEARRAFVAQKHAEGRITFIDLDEGQARTLTGFELGARVVDGTGN